MRQRDAVKAVVVGGGTLPGIDAVDGSADEVFATGCVLDRSADRVFLGVGERREQDQC